MSEFKTLYHKYTLRSQTVAQTVRWWPLLIRIRNTVFNASNTALAWIWFSVIHAIACIFHGLTFSRVRIEADCYWRAANMIIFAFFFWLNLTQRLSEACSNQLITSGKRRRQKNGGSRWVHHRSPIRVFSGFFRSANAIRSKGWLLHAPFRRYFPRLILSVGK